ncbi:UDP-N-acetylmuramoyl-L-alanine--D-glutamate ligase [Luteolibacter pohnpeiensis]|uniref:UDP-N-acetylmuramoylalanine--D-glutamate ligase n=1 Tax=Luteolibacter pohnpeiensis TaxID=454153 RepID=A0A934SDY5_9BACT|nr:UDP-N-acetylmuramoyl-L-alanine--D-glutamate ligase [Luteolibacter pohnpeiensis]MBK1883458.1 UDP-N-acetylmuramoyl-L-alanine--D-glutamate ligase [Luteolibacter pohnpeiensis]
MNLTGKHVAILGVGRSGRAAAALALREGATVSAWDSAGPAAFQGMPEQVEIHPNATAEQGASLVCDLLVVSPGIDTYGPYVEAFSKHAGEVIGEVELASCYYEGRIVGITGTNGKTTTTELVARILSHAGLGGSACGNYGVPFAEIVLQKDQPAAVSLELSSFQLETIRTLHPAVAVWLNFAPDHMDRYPTVESYRVAKLRIFENQTSSDAAVVRDGEEIGDLAPPRISFSTTNPEADWYSDGHVVKHGGEIVLDLDHETGLRGLHNAENAMAALAACKELGIELDVMREAMRGYAPPPHRCELVRTLDGVEYLNDSKATNLHALESALRSQTRPVILIAGGKDKGLDYRPVLPLLEKKALAAVTFGQIADPLAELFSKSVTSRSVPSLGEAIAAARTLAPRGSTIILSPGTSSFDQFSGYEERGDTFRALVHQLR